MTNDNRLPWVICLVLGTGCAAVMAALVRSQAEVASLEARLAIAERAQGDGTPAGRDGERRGRLRGDRWFGARGARAHRADVAEAGSGENPEGTHRDGATVDDEAIRSDRGAETRAARVLEALERAMAQLELDPETADAVREIYEESFEAGAGIRAEVRAGDRDEESGRGAHQDIRDTARDQLESLLEPEELRVIRRAVRRGGRGRL
ncbi:MAG: hypothetical protein VX265_08770 [Myxococcota bacterium]|nr:hypothetical protein [Myxococcota bacterium]MEC8425372.1 hypothetical protein [Myxococcota bacterium]